MKDRETLQGSLCSSTDNEFSLEIIGEILLDIRDLLQRLQPPTIISTDAPVPTLDTDTREK